MGSKFGQATLQSLAEYLCSLAPPGSGPAVFATLQTWSTQQVPRKAGSTTGQLDTYYVSGDGKRFRSRTDVARHFGLVVRTPRVAKDKAEDGSPSGEKAAKPEKPPKVPKERKPRRSSKKDKPNAPEPPKKLPALPPLIPVLAGLPEEARTAALIVWQFSCTFASTLDLEPIPLQQLTRELADRATTATCVGGSLGALHVALLKMLVRAAPRRVAVAPVPKELAESVTASLPAPGTLGGGPVANVAEGIIPPRPPPPPRHTGRAPWLPDTVCILSDVAPLLNALTWPEVLRQLVAHWSEGAEREEAANREGGPEPELRLLAAQLRWREYAQLDAQLKAVALQQLCHRALRLCAEAPEAALVELGEVVRMSKELEKQAAARLERLEATHAAAVAETEKMTARQLQAANEQHAEACRRHKAEAAKNKRAAARRERMLRNRVRLECLGTDMNSARYWLLAETPRGDEDDEELPPTEPPLAPQPSTLSVTSTQGEDSPVVKEPKTEPEEAPEPEAEPEGEPEAEAEAGAGAGAGAEAEDEAEPEPKEEEDEEEEEDEDEDEEANEGGEEAAADEGDDDEGDAAMKEVEEAASEEADAPVANESAAAPVERVVQVTSAPTNLSKSSLEGTLAAAAAASAAASAVQMAAAMMGVGGASSMGAGPGAMLVQRAQVVPRAPALPRPALPPMPGMLPMPIVTHAKDVLKEPTGKPHETKSSKRKAENDKKKEEKEKEKEAKAAKKKKVAVVIPRRRGEVYVENRRGEGSWGRVRCTLKLCEALEARAAQFPTEGALLRALQAAGLQSEAPAGASDATDAALPEGFRTDGHALVGRRTRILARDRRLSAPAADVDGEGEEGEEAAASGGGGGGGDDDDDELEVAAHGDGTLSAWRPPHAVGGEAWLVKYDNDDETEEVTAAAARGGVDEAAHAAVHELRRLLLRSENLLHARHGDMWQSAEGKRQAAAAAAAASEAAEAASLTACEEASAEADAAEAEAEKAGRTVLEQSAGKEAEEKAAADKSKEKAAVDAEKEAGAYAAAVKKQAAAAAAAEAVAAAAKAAAEVKKKAKAPPQPQLQPQPMHLMRVFVPMGVQGGQAIQVRTPFGLVKVMVPPGLQQGQTFEMAVPPPPQLAPPPPVAAPPMPALNPSPATLMVPTQPAPAPPAEPAQPAQPVVAAAAANGAAATEEDSMEVDVDSGAATTSVVVVANGADSVATGSSSEVVVAASGDADGADDSFTGSSIGGGEVRAGALVWKGVAAWRQLAGSTTGLDEARSLLVVLGAAAAAAAGRGAKESTTKLENLRPETAAAREESAREGAEFDAWVRAWEWRTARSLTLAQLALRAHELCFCSQRVGRVSAFSRVQVSVMDREGDHTEWVDGRVCAVWPSGRFRIHTWHVRGVPSRDGAREWCQDFEAPDSRGGRKAHGVQWRWHEEADSAGTSTRHAIRTAKAESNESKPPRASRQKSSDSTASSESKPPAVRQRSASTSSLGSSSGVRPASLPLLKGLESTPDGLPDGWICTCHVTPSGQHYKRYRGPNGERAQSLKQAWIQHASKAETSTAAASGEASGPAAADAAAPAEASAAKIAPGESGDADDADDDDGIEAEEDEEIPDEADEESTSPPPAKKARPASATDA